MSAASGGNSEPKQGQRSQSARGFCPRSTMRVPQPDIIEHFGNADAVPQLPERCLSRKAGIVRCCHCFGEVSFVSAMDRAVGAGRAGAQCAPLRSLLGKTSNKNILSSVPIALNRLLFTLSQPALPQYKISIILKFFRFLFQKGTNNPRNPVITEAR